MSFVFQNIFLVILLLFVFCFWNYALVSGHFLDLKNIMLFFYLIFSFALYVVAVIFIVFALSDFPWVLYFLLCLA